MEKDRKSFRENCKKELKKYTWSFCVGKGYYFFAIALMIVSVVAGIWCVATNNVIGDVIWWMFLLGNGMVMVAEFRKIILRYREEEK